MGHAMEYFRSWFWDSAGTDCISVELAFFNWLPIDEKAVDCVKGLVNTTCKLISEANRRRAAPNRRRLTSRSG